MEPAQEQKRPAQIQEQEPTLSPDQFNDACHDIARQIHSAFKSLVAEHWEGHKATQGTGTPIPTTQVPATQPGQPTVPATGG